MGRLFYENGAHRMVFLYQVKCNKILLGWTVPVYFKWLVGLSKTDNLLLFLSIGHHWYSLNFLSLLHVDHCSYLRHFSLLFASFFWHHISGVSSLLQHSDASREFRSKNRVVILLFLWYYAVVITPPLHLFTPVSTFPPDPFPKESDAILIIKWKNSNSILPSQIQ